jgi:antitoxin HigA-1
LSGPKGPPARPRLRLSVIIENIVPRTPIHPGEHLALELNELDMSAAELARLIDVPMNRVTAIINGERGVTADTALRLGHWFGTAPEFWLNLQLVYELRAARQELGDRLKKLPTLNDLRDEVEAAPDQP